MNMQRGRIQWELVATDRIVVRIGTMHQRLRGQPLSTLRYRCLREHSIPTSSFRDKWRIPE
jgi:hypothetical protein